MIFQTFSEVGGSALHMRVFLYSSQRRACLLTQTGPFLLPRGQRVSMEVLLDEADVCPTPVTIENMAVNVEGSREIASRQEWGLRYTFAR